MPTKFRVRIALAAERDIEAIWAYIARDNAEAANGFIQRFETQVHTLERFPERCPLIPENRLLGTHYRHFLIGNYRSIFRIAGKTVFVLRIVHDARLLSPAMLEE